MLTNVGERILSSFTMPTLQFSAQISRPISYLYNLKSIKVTSVVVHSHPPATARSNFQAFGLAIVESSILGIISILQGREAIKC